MCLHEVGVSAEEREHESLHGSLDREVLLPVMRAEPQEGFVEGVDARGAHKASELVVSSDPAVGDQELNVAEGAENGVHEVAGSPELAVVQVGLELAEVYRKPERVVVELLVELSGAYSVLRFEPRLHARKGHEISGVHPV